MKPDARIQTAKEIFSLAFNQNLPADRVITTEIKKRRYIGSTDRREISNTIWNVFRNMAKISFLLNAKNIPISADTLFSESLYPLNNHTFPEQVKLECPPCLWEDLKDKTNDLNAMQNEACVNLRINITKTNRNIVTNILLNEGIIANQCNFSPIGLKLLKRCNLQASDAFKKGLVEIQDEGSQIISLMIPAKPKNKIVDLCAGGGGKTLALYDLTLGKTDITSCDVANQRLKQLIKRAKRANFNNIKTHLLSNDYEPWLSLNSQSFDLVIVDAPCSGTGTWRRAPDAKWRLTKELLILYEQTQKEILSRAAKLVKKGGKLIYITCSLRKNENEKQFDDFLSKNPDFYPEKNLNQRFKNLIGKDFPEPILNGCFYISPAIFQTDGFFFAEANRK